MEGKFTPYGKWMVHPTLPTSPLRELSASHWQDGWESRRKRIPGNDYCIIQLGFPGRIRGVLVDTAHFTGNQAMSADIRKALRVVGCRCQPSAFEVL